MVNIMNCYIRMLNNVMKLAGMSTQEVEIEPGTTMHFLVPSKKSNSKPHIVLVHGFQADGILTWQFQILSLRKKYNVYVPDLLFFGKSYTSRSERSTRFQADCLAIGLISLGLAKNCVYVGFSYGGMVGFQLAEHHPELVGSMVITDSVLAETESISRKALERTGCSNWSDCLLPTTVEGVKVSIDVSSNKKNFPWVPNFFFKHYLELHLTTKSAREKYHLLRDLKKLRKMVNTVSSYKTMLHKVMKLAGMKSKEVEIEPGTIMHFWVPSKENNKKPNIVLVHGFAGDGILTWQFQILTLRKKYNIYVPDLLFFGKSYTYKNERTPKFQADYLAFGLRMLGLEKNCIVVGFSYGGMVAFQLAEHHPELVGSMVITGSVLAETESISSKALARIGFASWVDYLIPRTVNGVKVLLDYCSFKNNFPRLPNLFYKHYLEVMFNNRKERDELLEALVIKDKDVTNHEFRQPIHLIWGNQDKIFDMEVANNLKERLGNKTKLLIVEDAGHLALLERPNVFNKRLKEALVSLSIDSKLSTN